MTFLDRVLTIGLIHISLLGRFSSAECYDPSQTCIDPCPAELACHQDIDCPPAFYCPPFCAIPEFCNCNAEGVWNCDNHFCAGKCIPIPTPTGPRGYEIIDLGTLGGLTANALAVNESGVVVGEADVPSGTRHAFRWESGSMIDLGEDLPPPWSSGQAASNSNQILVQNGEGTLFLWTDGHFEQICTPQTCNFIRAIAINDSGQVLATRNGVSFLWDDNKVIDIDSLLGISTITLNNFGSFGGATQVVTNQYHAAIATYDTVQTLGTLGGLESYVSDINDFGQAIGGSERAPGGDRFYWGFLWTNDQMIDLSLLLLGANGFQVGSPRSINNCGEIIGSGNYQEMVFANSGFIYQHGNALRDLFDLIPAEAKWYLLNPNDINDHGDIVGYGFYDGDFGPYQGLTRAFLARPIPGDLNTDGNVDLKDFGHLQNAFTGEYPPPGGRCLRADADRDNDVDLADFALFEDALPARP